MVTGPIGVQFRSNFQNWTSMKSKADLKLQAKLPP